MKLVYSKKVEVSYGLFVCPECDSRFFGGGKALHHYGCSISGYEGVEFHFGPSQVVEVQQTAKRFGEDHEWYGISLKMLKDQFPELV